MGGGYCEGWKRQEGDDARREEGEDEKITGGGHTRKGSECTEDAEDESENAQETKRQRQRQR